MLQFRDCRLYGIWSLAWVGSNWGIQGSEKVHPCYWLGYLSFQDIHGGIADVFLSETDWLAKLSDGFQLNNYTSPDDYSCYFELPLRIHLSVCLGLILWSTLLRDEVYVGPWIDSPPFIALLETMLLSTRPQNSLIKLPDPPWRQSSGSFPRSVFSRTVWIPLGSRDGHRVWEGSDVQWFPPLSSYGPLWC